MEDQGRGAQHGKFPRQNRGDYQKQPYQRNEGNRGYNQGNRQNRPNESSPNPVQRKHEEAEERLKSLIVRVGDKGSTSVESNLEALSHALEADLPKHKISIIDFIIQCTGALPTKTPVYGTLVGLLNARSFDFGRDLVQKLSVKLQENITNQTHLDEVRMLLRFVGELTKAKVIPASNLITLMNEILRVVREAVDDTRKKRRSDYYCFVLLSMIPWVAKELEEKESQEFNTLLSNIESFLAKRNPISNLQILQVWGTDQEDYLTQFWASIKQLKSEDWETSTIVKPQAHFASKLASSQQHQLGAISFPPYQPTIAYPIRTMFRLFDKSDSEKDLKPIDRFLVEDYIIDILFFFNINHKEAVKQIQSIPLPNSFDHLLLETLFGQLFQFPKPTFKEVYYAVLVLDFCKSNPNFGQVLGLGIESIWEKIESMDFEAFDRFTSWFSYHLSNTDYKWPWAAWDYILKLRPDSIKSTFVREVLEKGMRLSYYERVKKTVPEEFHVFMPDKPTFYFKFDYTETNSEGAAEANELFTKLRNKETPENIVNLVLEGPTFSKVTTEVKLDILVQCVLKIGQKSFSHLLAAIDRNTPILKKYIINKETEVIALKACREFWQKSHQHIIILVERLLISKIVDSTAVIDWLFTPSESQNLTMSYYRDILRIAINKSLSRTETIKDELKLAEDALQRVPTEERNENIPETKRVKDRRVTLENSVNEFKGFITNILQQLCNLISERTSKHMETSEIWHHAALSLVKEVGRKYLNSRDLSQAITTLEYTPVDQKVVNILQQLKQL